MAFWHTNNVVSFLLLSSLSSLLHNLIQCNVNKQYENQQTLLQYPFQWQPYIHMSQYHSQPQLEALLHRYEADFPELVRVKTLGSSVKGEKILAIRISDHPHEEREANEPAVKYVANMHGNEVVGREMLLSFVEYLCEGYYSNDTIRNLVESNDIWIVPTMNPDGFKQSKQGECCTVKGRSNANGVDLNRNFKILDGKGKFTEKYERHSFEAETKVLADFISKSEHQFVLSINFHGGAIVANYPYDARYKGISVDRDRYALSPDDDVFRSLALLYSSWNPEMFRQDQKRSQCGGGPPFEKGITNGAEWYEVEGGMQDYNYFKSNTFELTVELGYCKYPWIKDLPPFWSQNKESLMYYIEAASNMGIHGSIIDATDGSPIENAVIKVDEINHDVVSVKDGSYWRLLVPGKTYHVSVNAKGYLRSKTRTTELTEKQRSQFINFYLYPLHTSSYSLSYSHLSNSVTKVKQEPHYRASLDPDKFISQLFQTYPLLTHIYSIGKSSNGLDINVLVISDNPGEHEPGEPELRLAASLHGNELVGLELLATFSEFLLKNYGVNDEITWLIDNTRIHILLSANPDGRIETLKFLNYDLTDQPPTKAWKKGRENGKGIDLNRDFNYNGSEDSLKKLQVETQHIINWVKSIPFVVGIMYHGGTKVVCYPFDNLVHFDVADIDAFQYIAKNYVETNPGMKSGYPCPKEWPNEKFPGGYLAGADWYAFDGGMQDVSYNYTNAFELTIEVSCEKIPPSRELPQHWEDNRESLMSLLRMAHIGVFGRVRSSVDDSYITNCTISVAEIGHDIKCTSIGEYWRLLAPTLPPHNTYTVTAHSPNFISQTKRVTITEENGGRASWSAQRLDFVLRPIPSPNSKDIYWPTKLEKLKTIEHFHAIKSQYSYSDILGIFKAFSTLYPNLVSVKYLGSNLEGYQIIDIVLCGAKDVSSVPHMALFGGLYETDRLSTNTLITFATDLLLSHSSNSTQTQLLQSTAIHIIPYFYPSSFTDIFEDRDESGEDDPDCDYKLDVNSHNNLLIQNITSTSPSREVRILHNWLSQHPIVYVLNVISGYQGVLTNSGLGQWTKWMLDEGTSSKQMSRNCPQLNEQDKFTASTIMRSLESDLKIVTSSIGVGCCPSTLPLNSTKYNVLYSAFSQYSKCVLYNISNHAVVIKAKTTSQSGKTVSSVTKGFSINITSSDSAAATGLPCTYLNNLASNTGVYQTLLTTPGVNNLTFKWDNNQSSVLVTAASAFVNTSHTYPRIIPVNFALSKGNVYGALYSRFPMTFSFTFFAVIVLLLIVLGWFCLRFWRGPAAIRNNCSGDKSLARKAIHVVNCFKLFRTRTINKSRRSKQDAPRDNLSAGDDSKSFRSSKETVVTNIEDVYINSSCSEEEDMFNWKLKHLGLDNDHKSADSLLKHHSTPK